MLNMEGSANDKVYAIPNSAIATNYYFDSEEGMELHSQGNSYTRRGSVNPQEIEGGRFLHTMLQSSPFPNYEINGITHVRNIGNHGHVAQAPSTPSPTVQMQQRRNQESRHQAANPSFPINPREIDHGRTIVSLSQVNPFPYQIRNQLDEVSSQAAFFKTQLANHHQESLPSAYNHQWRGFHVHGQAVVNPTVVHAQQVLGEGVDSHRSANVAPEPSRVRGTNVLQGPYHVDNQNNVK